MAAEVEEFEGALGAVAGGDVAVCVYGSDVYFLGLRSGLEDWDWCTREGLHVSEVLGDY